MKTFLALVLILAAGGTAFFFFTRKPASSANFHPDAVLEFTWTAGDVAFSEKRPVYTEPWDPPVAPDTVESKLKPLASVKLEKMKPADKGEVSVVIGFGGTNRWSGVYHDGDFVWTEGLKRGMGFHADENWRKIFEEGRYGFRQNEVNFCPSRPQKLVLQLDGNYEFENVNKAWVRRTNGKAETLDGNFMDNWFSKNCALKINHFRDLGVFPFSDEAKRGSLLLIYPDGQTMIWSLRGEYWEVQPGLSAMNSEQLTGALKQLTSTNAR